MEFFLKAALDTFSESIQIYDRNAMAVYFNTAGLDSMDFPPDGSGEQARLGAF